MFRVTHNEQSFFRCLEPKMSPSPSRSRRILVVLGVVTFVQIAAFLLLRKHVDLSTLSPYFSSKLSSQEYEEEILANSSIIEEVVQR